MHVKRVYEQLCRVALLGVLLAGCTTTRQEQQRTALQAEIQARELAVEEQQGELARRSEELETLAATLTAQQEDIAREAERLKSAEEELKSRQKAVRKVVPQGLPPPVPSKFLLVGAREQLTLDPPEIQLLASMDTGSRRCTLGVYQLTEFERDGEPHVRFSIVPAAGRDRVEITRPLKKRLRASSLNSSAKKRPVVEMRVRLGSINETTEFLLVEDNDAEFSEVSIGRDLLRDLAIVDVSKQKLVKANTGNQGRSK